jgi:hypothetical protein
VIDERRLAELKNQSKQLFAKDSSWRYPEMYVWIWPHKIEPIRQPFDGVLTIASVMGRVERVIIIK